VSGPAAALSRCLLPAVPRRHAAPAAWQSTRQLAGILPARPSLGAKKFGV